MIRLKRTRTAAGIHPDFTGDKLVEKLVALADARLALGGALEFTGALGDWGKTKSHLQLESANKCAYCEADTATVAYGDVEHFRPKSVYWWLALCVDNYVYSCQICNQKHKGDRFPIRGQALAAPKLPRSIPKTAAARKRLAAAIAPDPFSAKESALRKAWDAEKADLPHPYLDDPESLFAWAAVETNMEVHLVPRTQGASSRSRRAVEAVEKHLGLNRETLRRQRYVIYDQLKSFLLVWRQGDAQLKQVAEQQIRAMCDGRRQFAGMCRYFSQAAGFT
jgi:hypothetical protein